MNSRCGSEGQILPPRVTEVLHYFLPWEGTTGTLCVQQEAQQGVFGHGGFRLPRCLSEVLTLTTVNQRAPLLCRVMSHQGKIIL